jgi:hypothetical protein
MLIRFLLKSRIRPILGPTELPSGPPHKRPIANPAITLIVATIDGVDCPGGLTRH